MRPDNASRFTTKTYPDTGAISTSDMRNFGRALATGAGIGLSVPTPVRELAVTGREMCIVNDQDNTDPITVETSSAGGISGRTQLMLKPGYRLDLEAGHKDGGFQWDAKTQVLPTPWSTWTSTLAWTTGTPATVVQACRYQVLEDKICVFEMELSSADGNDASQLTATLPILPWVSCDIPVRAEATIDGTESKQMGYIDAGNATHESRLLTFRTFSAWTNAKACSIIIKGWYPIAPMTSWSPTFVWGTEDPAAQTTVAVYSQIGDAVFFILSTLASDGNTSSSLTSSLPTCGHALDLDTYVKAVGIQKVNTTYTDCMPYVDMAANTVATRLLKFDNFTSHTNSAAHSEVVSGWYFINSATSFVDRLDATWTTGTPASITKKAHYTTIGDFCLFSIYVTSADSNGCTALTLAPPLVPLVSTTKLILGGYQLNNATPVECLPCLQAQEIDMADRIIEFDAFATCTDAATVTVKVSGMYKIAG